ncbi:hypothetical protein M430DRAFT_137540 [Amorphotheca resinae ATCC 22711]|uniref:Methyltransferase n=1 Tax=Amorphotheca resinae ATCC 22711 TaxID=857342 RepID=A0A2T3B6H2_AMORE|nr:hypothetical protein M430DRAFT_137540 [Amorphotheca resinae ATCC 22711]PSS22369.1 hypothetical protein M430DRAFT_137540 [Amorphotheca resinae ATCC 22711]
MDSPVEKTTLQFIQWSDLYTTEKPFQIFIDLPPSAGDARRTNVVFEQREVILQDMRGSESSFSLDRHGFIARHHARIPGLESPTTSFIETVYLPAVIELLKREVEGADRVVIFDWRVSRSAHARAEDESVDLKDLSDRLAPARSVHVDQAPLAAFRIVSRELPQEAEELLRGRFRIINVWRPLQHAVEDWPLAVCDGSTVDDNDLLETDIVRRDFREHVGANMFALHRERYRWYYLSRQQPDEVLIFKQFDTESGVKARFCPHSSFKWSRAHKGALPRESVEVRALVFTDA